MENKLILAMGASGKFAGLVIPELVKRGAHIRGFVHHEEDSQTVLKNGASEVAVGDLHDRKSIDAALQGVESVFYIAPAFQQDEAQMGLQMVDAARQAKVKRFVFSSVIHPVLSMMQNHAAKPHVEETLLMSEMEYTILEPAIFFQNFAGSWDTVQKTGVFSEPYSKTQKMSYVDYRDVAECVAIALTEDKLLNGTFELCGENSLNREDIAQIMSQVLNRPIKAADVDFEEWYTAVKLPPSPSLKHGLQKMYAYYNQHSLFGNNLTLKAILGRPPRTMEAYLKELHVKERTLQTV